MIYSIKYAACFFLGMIAPITIFNAALLYFVPSCDPKFGCWGTFQLLTLIVACCALLASVAALLSCYVQVVRQHNPLSKKQKMLAGLIALALSLSTNGAVALMESIAVTGTALLYFFVSLVLNSLVLRTKRP